VFRGAEVAPVIFVGAEGDDFFSGGSEAQIRGDDREDAFFCDEVEQARGDDVDSAEGEWVQVL